MVKPQVVLYHYNESPFATKVKNLLLLKKIPHKRVDVAMTLPRPEITDILGIKYRRIPILAIGNDVYCDTSLIAAVLERRFPTSEGYGTLFPKRVGSDKSDTGLAKALAVYWNDRTIFPIGANSLPYSRFDAKFLADRAAWAGKPVDVKALSATQGTRTSSFASHLALIEEQLQDGRQWLLDTEQPGLVDIDVHFLISWLRNLKTLREVYDPALVPKTLEWIARTTKWIEENQKAQVASFEKISGDEAAKLIVSSTHEDEKIPGFEPAEAKRLGVQFGDTVNIMPTDNARIPTYGRLVVLNREEVAIDVSGSVGVVRVHFPRLEFKISVGQPSKL